MNRRAISNAHTADFRRARLDEGHLTVRIPVDWLRLAGLTLCADDSPDFRNAVYELLRAELIKCLAAGEHGITAEIVNSSGETLMLYRLATSEERRFIGSKPVFSNEGRKHQVIEFKSEANLQ